MSRLTLLLIVILCSALVVFPLWASFQGSGAPSVKKERNSSGKILYIGSRGWISGGPSGGK